MASDFNAVLSLDERRGEGPWMRDEDVVDFQNFVHDANLVDLPLVGRKYTWYRPNGTAMRRLDRFLLSKTWLEKWPHLSQWAGARGLSDHCPIILKETKLNWGPKPFRVFNGWRDFSGYGDFVKEQWESFEVRSWAGFVAKEKLKMLKSQLKGWSKDHVSNIDQ